MEGPNGSVFLSGMGSWVPRATGAISQLVSMTDKEVCELKCHMIFRGHPLLICRDQSHVIFLDLGHGT